MDFLLQVKEVFLCPFFAEYFMRNRCRILLSAFFLHLLRQVSSLYCSEYIDIVSVKPALYSWDKTHLVMMNYPFNVLGGSLCQNFVWNSYKNTYKEY